MALHEPDPATAQTDELGARYAKVRALVARAARSLHDDLGPSLAGIGLQLILLKDDCPKSAEYVDGLLNSLNEALERIRALSGELNPSPVDRLGLEAALRQLAKQDSRIRVSYTVTRIFTREIASVLYEITVDTIAAAIAAKAAHIDVQANGELEVTIQVSDDGEQSDRIELKRLVLALAKNSSIIFQIRSGKSTIVSIIHADRRLAGRGS